MNIYNLVSGQIGIKRLTDPDLGVITSHQTHIGLYEGTLSHLPYERKAYNSQLIYNSTSYEGLLFLKFINNNRSPAINLGSIIEQRDLPNNVVSVGKKVREIADTNRNLSWYLIWFALDNDEIITILLNQNSTEIIELNSLGIDLAQLSNRGLKIGTENSNYNRLAQFLNNITTTVNLEYIDELETATQTGNEKVSKRKIPRPQDLERANKIFKAIGEEGERLLFQYLESEKRQSNIRDFKWLNQSREMYEPYDFEIIQNNGDTIFSDAKATNKNFEDFRPIYLSSNELSFINDNKENYLIHRLYSIGEEPKMRVCDNIHTVSDIFIPDYNTFKNSLNAERLSIQGVKLAVPTNLDMLNFENEILLNANA